MIVVEKGQIRSAVQPAEARELAERALELLDLEVAEVQMAPGRDGPAILDVLPSPSVSEFEAVTDEHVAGGIADSLLKLGGTN
jgi:hypothetical protein